MAGTIDDNFGEPVTVEQTQIQRDREACEQDLRQLRDATAYALRAIRERVTRHGRTALFGSYSAAKRQALASVYDDFRAVLGRASDKFSDIPAAAALPADPAPQSPVSNP